MSKRLLLSIAALAVGISACNDSALPTDAERDLLKNPSGAPLLGNSLYGEALLTDSASTVPPDTILRIIPVWPIEQIGGTPAGHEHIEAAPDITKYKPIGYDHITSGPYRSRYKPEGSSEHQIGANNPEYSLYVPPGYIHITSGSNKSKYRKPGTTTPVTPTPTFPDTVVRVIPVWPIEQIGGTPTGHEHIEAAPDITKYKPIGYDHITSGPYVSRYKPSDHSEHQIGASNPEYSLYVPPGYIHITSGSNKSKYRKPTPTPPDTTTPTNPPTNPPGGGAGGGSSN